MFFKLFICNFSLLIQKVQNYSQDKQGQKETRPRLSRSGQKRRVFLIPDAYWSISIFRCRLPRFH
jgi:hypothetical protein